MSPQGPEAALQRSVIALARTSGYLVAHHHDSRRQIKPGVHVGDRDAAGLPDLVIAGHGVVLFVELKSDMGRLSLAQQRWRDALQAVERAGDGSVRWRLWRPRDWELIVDELQGIATRRWAA